MKDEVKKIVQRLDEDFAKIPDELLDSVRKQFERQSTSVKLDAHTATYNRLFRSPKTKACTKSSIITICGRGTTNSAGVAKIPIVFCDQADGSALVIVDVLCFVATPAGKTPVVLSAPIQSTTVQTAAGEFLALADPQATRLQYLDNVTAEVMAWQLNEQPAAGTAFSWSCTVEVAKLLYVGG